MIMKNLIKREQNKQVCFAESENSRTKFKRMVFCLMAMMGVLTLSAQSIYDFTVKDDAGKDVSLSEYKGKVLLIVNTATRCGFTPQYKDLEPLYQKYHAQGFEILDFPCNQFGQQAPGTIQEIHSFCTANFDIHFPQFDKIDVNGENAHPLYTWLKTQAGGGDIKWNFTKFLVGRDGKVIKRYESRDQVATIETDMQMEVNPVLSNIMARRSIRKYLDKPVEHEKLEVIVKCGINAPSGMNRQPWIIRVVEDQKLIADVNEVFKQDNPEQVARDKDFKNMFRNAPTAGRKYDAGGTSDGTRHMLPWWTRALSAVEREMQVFP